MSGSLASDAAANTDVWNAKLQYFSISPACRSILINSQVKFCNENEWMKQSKLPEEVSVSIPTDMVWTALIRSWDVSAYFGRINRMIENNIPMLVHEKEQ